MEPRENEGLMSYIQSHGTAEAIKEFTVDEIMELIMNINSKISYTIQIDATTGKKLNKK